MESGFAAGHRPAWTIRNCLLSQRPAKLRRCRSCTGRISFRPSVIGKSTTSPASLAHDLAENYDPDVGAIDSIAHGRFGEPPLPTPKSNSPVATRDYSLGPSSFSVADLSHSALPAKTRHRRKRR